MVQRVASLLLGTTAVVALSAGILAVTAALVAGPAGAEACSAAATARLPASTTVGPAGRATEHGHPRLISAATDRPTPPTQLAGFYALNSIQQLAAVTALQGDPHLPTEVLTFLRRAVADRLLDATTRNNIANGLLRQQPPLEDLEFTFAATIDDPAESYQAREYAVQHLAQAAAASQNPQAIVAKLMRLMEIGELGIPGTAMIQLHRLESEGLVQLDENYSTRVRTLLEDRSSNLLVRMSALALLGERHDIDALPAVRYLVGKGVPALRRVAIACLGQLGDGRDLALLRPALDDLDPGIALAATAACARLRSAGDRPSTQ